MHRLPIVGLTATALALAAGAAALAGGTGARFATLTQRASAAPAPQRARNALPPGNLAGFSSADEGYRTASDTATDTAAAGATRPYRFPDYGLSFALPTSWSAVSYQDRRDVLARFKREHPQWADVVDSLGPQHKFVASPAAGGDGLLVSIWTVGASYTLQQHIRENLSPLESESEITIYGKHAEIVALPGGRAWRVRWSYGHGSGTLQFVQYTFVQAGLGYLFTYRTAKPYAQYEGVFDASARSIGLAPRPSSANSTPAQAGGKIAYDSDVAGPRDVWVMNPGGSGKRRLTRGPGDSLHPSWSPDGRRIVFARSRAAGVSAGKRQPAGSDLYVMDADGRRQRRLTNDHATEAEPTWSPDGSSIAFVRGSCEPTCDIYVVRSDGTGEHRLTRTGASGSPTWSPDGTRIAFTSVHGADRFDIYAINVDGTGVRNLTSNLPGNSVYPSWSPDGQTLVFSYHALCEDCILTLAFIGTDGSHVRYVDTGTCCPSEPAWSPDGKQIVFQNQQTLRVIDAAGGSSSRIAFSGNNHNPSWKPG